MSGTVFITIAGTVFALTAAAGAAKPARAQESQPKYANMAPLDQYLMERDTEIALARSAAPPAIANDAEVLVLGRQGYEVAVKGTNGFACVVERSWMAPFGSPEFWNPKIRGALCFNPPASRSLLPIEQKRTEMVLAHVPTAQVIEVLKRATAKKEWPPLEPGAMCYMMSKQAYLTDDGDHNLAHLMFYTPIMNKTNWGADVPDSPVILGVAGSGAEPYTVFIVPVGRWSDGSAAPVM
ncbi:MAG TPA: hypothetical protein VMU61_07310 [Candidatus Aquilonibacter sp.]|nr:hypothetical protein [Candidatus Aquilonibacter sp.]